MITARRNCLDALLIAERDGERCAGPVLIAGVVIGVGVVQLTTQGLKESGHLSLHLLMLLVLELIGPVLVSVLGMALLLPRWLERVDVAPVRAWKQGIPSAALVGALLMVMFLAASLIAGVLMTPRGEVINEMINLLRTMDLRDVIRSILRCAGFLCLPVRLVPMARTCRSGGWSCQELHRQQSAGGRLDDRPLAQGDLVPGRACLRQRGDTVMTSDGMNTTPAERGQRRDRLLFLGSGLLILIALLVGLARAQRWGTRYVDVYIQAKDVNGLKRGEEIRIAGIPVGQVGRLQLTDQGKVTVQLQIDDSKAFLVGPSSKVRLAQEGLMGNPYVVISADPRPKDQGVTINGRTLHYAEPINLDRLLHEFAATQKQLRLTLRHTAELTEANGDIANAQPHASWPKPWNRKSRPRRRW